MVCQGKLWGNTKGADVGDEWGAGEDVVHDTRSACMGEVGKVSRLGEQSNVVEDQKIMGFIELKKELAIANRLCGVCRVSLE